jgi:hypothetical protein
VAAADGGLRHAAPLQLTRAIRTVESTLIKTNLDGKYAVNGQTGNPHCKLCQGCPVRAVDLSPYDPPCTAHSSVGSVPGMNASRIVFGQAGFAILPVSRSIST